MRTVTAKPEILRTTTLLLALTISAAAQSTQTSPPAQEQPTQTPQTQDAAKPTSDTAKPATSDSATASKPATPMTAAEKRRADLQADTERLYKLTQELKAEVDKSNKDTLSVSVIKKAQEVERLAKSIKERSKQQ